MTLRHAAPTLILAAFTAATGQAQTTPTADPAALAEPSSYGCAALETASALPSVEGLDGVFYRVLADLRMRHPMEDAVMAQMGALSQALAEGGTTLIYVAVPTKSQAMRTGSIFRILKFSPLSRSMLGYFLMTASLYCA